MIEQIYNPYLPSYEYIPDGEPKVFGDRLYIFGSHDRFDGEFYCMNDYACWSAPVSNLKEWRYEGLIYKKSQDPLSSSGARSPFTKDGLLSMFAPDVVQGLDGRYYMFYGMDFINQISVAVSDTPAGEYKYYGVVSHEDGTIYGQKEGDTFQFDTGVLVDDSQIWLYTGFSPKKELIDQYNSVFDFELKGEGNYVAELDSDMLTLKSKPKNLLPGWGNSKGTGFEGHEFFEASSIRKFHSKYYLIYSSILSHELAYAVSDYPDKDFEFGGSLHTNGGIVPNITEKATYYWGNNHGSIEEVDGSFYIFAHRQTNYSEFSRQGIAEKLSTDNEGKFQFAEMTSIGLNVDPLIDKAVYPASIACVLYSKFGAVKSIEVSEQKKENSHPCITQNAKDGDRSSYQYIMNMQNQSVAGYKYFDFSSPSNFKAVVRGQGSGKLKVSLSENGNPFVVLSIEPSKQWKEYAVEINEKIRGINSLYIKYEGDDSIDFKEFGFSD